jgi:hypothetical protein
MKINWDKNEFLKIEGLEPKNKISYWQLIALQSRANGCFYQFEKLPQVKWQWPTGTWFQARLAKNNDMPSFRHSV